MNLSSHRSVFIMLAVAALLAVIIVAFAPSPEVRSEKQLTKPLVDTTALTFSNIAIPIHSRGRVKAKREHKITTSVDGLVVSIDDKLLNGMQVNKGDVLLKLDRQPLILDVAHKQADLDNALLHLEETKAKARVARETSGKNAPKYARYVPQLRRAESQIKAAEAALNYANRQLANATIRAPISGKLVDVYVQPGDVLKRATPIATLYDMRQLEVRIPLSDQQLAIIGLAQQRGHLEQQALEKSEKNTGQTGNTKQNHTHSPTVTISDFVSTAPASPDQQWQGHISRVESVRGRNQLLYAVTTVNEARVINNAGKTLLPGSFIEAKITGKKITNIVVLSRDTIQANDKLWWIDEDGKARLAEISIIYRGREQVYLRSDLPADTPIIISNYQQLSEGLPVTVRQTFSIANQE